MSSNSRDPEPTPDASILCGTADIVPRNEPARSTFPVPRLAATTRLPMTDKPESTSFKDLFDQNSSKDFPRAVSIRVGSQVTGVVSHVGEASVFVELDGKQQGYFESVDLASDGAPALAVGDEVKAIVVSVEAASGQIKLARRFTKEANVDQLRIAREQAVPVEGKVTGVNKGGVSVEIGSIRAFCPMSQLDNRFVNDASIYLQQTLEFLVTEIRGEKDVVLSRRALLELRAKDAKQSSLEKFVPGSRHHGRVSQLRDFGAFVEIEGVEGLIPMRELSHDRSAKPSDVVTLGDVVEVEVLDAGLEATKRGGERVKLTLSLKRLANDPWDAVEVLVPVGRVLAGTVVRTAEFGAFVRLASGIEGLLPNVELSGKAKRAAEAFEAGQQVMVVARSIDRAKKRIGLVLAADGAEAGAISEARSIPTGAIVKAVVEKVETFGVFVQVEGTKGRSGRGLIPNSELGIAHGVDLRKHFPEGKVVTATVLEAGDRMRLSIKRALEDEERSDFDSFRASQASSSGMGTFGDLLKKKFGK